MKLVVNRTTRKDNKKIKKTNSNYDKTQCLYLKIITKSHSHQTKPKQNNSSYTSLEKYMVPVLERVTGRQKRAKKGRNSKIRFFFNENN